MSIFTKVQMRKPKYNTFDLSHERKFSAPFGMLVPIHLMECVPGDKIHMSTSQMLRMAPMLAPIMHQVTMYTHFFFVPNRLVWSNWESFITGGEDGQDASVFPTIDTTFDTNSIGDFFGLPNTVGVKTIQVSALPFAMYQLIWNEYFRDQNLQTVGADNPDPQLTDGDNTANTLLVARHFRSWQHDYFTSALPFTQKGAEATIPLGTSADIDLDPGESGLDFDGSIASEIQRIDGSTFLADDVTYPASAGIPPTANLRITGTDAAINVSTNHSIDTSVLSVNLSSATAATINDLRNAFRLQEWLEKNARGGSRYIESILSHFGVRSSDARLQRPEFLGGGATRVSISEVLQTSDNTTQNTPLGTQGGHGIAVGANNRISYFCEEHGYIIGIMSILPKTSYQQGIHKHFLKWDKFDYYWPEFAHLGEQAIQNKEIYVTTDGQDDEVFGYTPRYAEYKFLNSVVCGEFKDTLDFWHLGRKFSTRPGLNTGFLQMAPANAARIFAVSAAEDQFYVHMHHKIKAKRPMPYFGTPLGA